MKKAMLVLAMFLVSGCGQDFQGDSANGAADEVGTTGEELATTVTVNLVGHQFVPASITVKKGTTVKFVNTSPMGHTVTSGAASSAPRAGSAFDKILGAGKSLNVKFTAVGSVPYFCRPHEAMGMKGVIVVTP